MGIGKKGDAIPLTCSKKISQKGKPSKLKTYLDVLQLLASTGPVEVEELDRLGKSGKGSKKLSSDIDFLVQQQMIQRNESRNNIMCFVTDRGKRMLLYFSMLPETLDIEDLDDIEDSDENCEAEASEETEDANEGNEVETQNGADAENNDYDELPDLTSDKGTGVVKRRRF